MNREDIIRIAQEAGFVTLSINEETWIPYLTRFAALVIANHPPQSFMTWQEGYEAGKQAEREACVKIVESDPSYDWHKFACEAANAIRARGQA